MEEKKWEEGWRVCVCLFWGGGGGLCEKKTYSRKKKNIYFYPSVSYREHDVSSEVAGGIRGKKDVK